jgi:hypothetical protein
MVLHHHRMACLASADWNNKAEEIRKRLRRLVRNNVAVIAVLVKTSGECLWEKIMKK